MRVRWICLFVLSPLPLCWSAGCGSEFSDESSGGTGGASTDSGSGGNAGSAGTDPLAQCKAEGPLQPNPECAGCVCDHCLSELRDCEADPTCVALRACAVAKCAGCGDICIGAQCGTELSAAGGLTGPGTAKASALRGCSEEAGCDCCSN